MKILAKTSVATIAALALGFSALAVSPASQAGVQRYHYHWVRHVNGRTIVRNRTIVRRTPNHHMGCWLWFGAGHHYSYHWHRHYSYHRRG